MPEQSLPASAYAALEGLKEQADAAMQMLPGQDKAAGKAALEAAQEKMARNEPWTRKIVRAILAGDGETTIVTADIAWLERTFSGSEELDR